jgi:hypothetical protein
MRWAMLLVVLLGACDDGDDPILAGDRGALENGQRCLFSNAGANVCAGQLCLDIVDGSAFGVCSEICGSSCRNGGECVEIDGFVGRACMVDCPAGDACGDDLSCLPSEHVRPCGAGGCEVDLNRFWCQPPLT